MPFVSSVRGTFGATSENRGVGNPGPIAELVRQDPNSSGLPTGGTITLAGGYRIHTFLNAQSGTNFRTPFAASASFPVEYMVIAGGGAGFTTHGSGGGGAGGYRTGTFTGGLNANTNYPVVVGAGRRARR